MTSLIVNTQNVEKPLYLLMKVRMLLMAYFVGKKKPNSLTFFLVTKKNGVISLNFFLENTENVKNLSVFCFLR